VQEQVDEHIEQEDEGQEEEAGSDHDEQQQ
jgi:hypothetical protein